MEVVHLDALEPEPRGRQVALGYFDGLHRGHQRILEAAASHGPPTVFTFPNHPASVLRPDRAPLLLTTFAEKEALLEMLGVDQLVWREFDLEFSHLEPEQFVREVLVGRLQARTVAVGPNYRYGFQACGTPATLAESGAELGVGVEVVPALDDGGRMISSTRIRGLIAAGEVGEAATLLGREYGAMARVVEGDRRGSQIGFPTANLECDPLKLLPGDGVYAVRFKVDGAHWHGVANLGVRPTFEARSRVLEVHLLDFSGDLYGREVEVRFVQRLREERRFSGVDALVAQIREDVAAARRVLGPALV